MGVEQGVPAGKGFAGKQIGFAITVITASRYYAGAYCRQKPDIQSYAVAGE